MKFASGLAKEQKTVWYMSVCLFTYRVIREKMERLNCHICNEQAVQGCLRKTVLGLPWSPNSEDGWKPYLCPEDDQRRATKSSVGPTTSRRVPQILSLIMHMNSRGEGRNWRQVYLRLYGAPGSPAAFNFRLEQPHKLGLPILRGVMIYE